MMVTHVCYAHDEFPSCVQGTGLVTLLQIKRVDLSIVATSRYEL